MGIFSTILFNIKNMKKAKAFHAMGKDALLALDDDAFYEAVDCICYNVVYDVNDKDITSEQRIVYSLTRFEAEVNNGGLCQFFVNSSGQCAPYISESLAAVGAVDLQKFFDTFVEENEIDVKDLSSFKVKSYDEFEAQTERFGFDSFDDAFYEDEIFHQQLIEYCRNNIEQLLKV